MDKHALTVHVKGKKGVVDGLSLSQVLRYTINALQEVERGMRANTRNKIRWNVVKISMDSPVEMVIEGCSVSREDDLENDVGANVVLGCKQLLSDATKLPDYLTEHAINKLYRIAKLTGNGISSVTISNKSEGTIGLNMKLAAEAFALIASDDYEEWTSVQGMLQRLDLHGDDPEFRIYNEVYPKGIACVFSPTIMQDVKKAIPDRFDSPTIVSVYGKSAVSKSGRITQIIVDDFETIETAESEQNRKGADIAQGTHVLDYVKKVRYGES